MLCEQAHCPGEEWNHFPTLASVSFWLFRLFQNFLIIMLDMCCVFWSPFFQNNTLNIKKNNDHSFEFWLSLTSFSYFWWWRCFQLHSRFSGFRIVLEDRGLMISSLWKQVWICVKLLHNVNTTFLAKTLGDNFAEIVQIVRLFNFETFWHFTENTSEQNCDSQSTERHRVLLLVMRVQKCSRLLLMQL